MVEHPAAQRFQVYDGGGAEEEDAWRMNMAVALAPVKTKIRRSAFSALIVATWKFRQTLLSLSVAERSLLKYGRQPTIPSTSKRHVAVLSSQEARRESFV